MDQYNAAQSVTGRYRALIIFITVFVMTIVSVLALNFYVSAQFEADAVKINLAGRQRMLSQRMVKSLQNILKAEQAGIDVAQPIEELKTVYGLFNDTLESFSAGGTTTDTTGQTVTLDAVSTPAARDALQEAKILWADYKDAVNAVIDTEVESLQAVSDATRLVTERNNRLLELTNSLTNVLESNGADPLLINISGRQRMLSQRLAKSLFEIELAQLSNTPINIPLDQLTESVRLFDSTLSAFDQGGLVVDTNGQSVEINPIEGEYARQLTAETVQVWQPVGDRLSQMLNSDNSHLNSLSEAITQGSEKNLSILSLMNDLTVALEQDAAKRSGLLRLIQIAGIAIALIMFGIIVFYFVRQLGKSDNQVNEARGETERILHTVKDGLFLMNTDHTIGNQYSSSLEEILNEKKPAGKNFLSILRKIVPEKTLETAEDYFGLLLGDRVHEDLIGDLNPLDELEVYFDKGEGKHQVRHLGFSFQRVKVEGAISHLLVQVDDITERVTLERDLQKSQEKAQAQFDLMLQVLHVEPDLLTQFLSGTEDSLKEINEILRKRSTGQEGNKIKLDHIFRIIHSVKGDASALGLDGFEQRAHEFEDTLQFIRNKSDISGKDFLPLTIGLDEFLNQIESLRTLILRLGDLQSSVRSESMGQTSAEVTPLKPIDSVQSTQQLIDSLKPLAEKVAQDQQKHVNIKTEIATPIPEAYHKSCKDILVQLIRNSIVHGIENTDERNSQNKPLAGTIQVSVTHGEDRKINLTFRDDGRGLLPEHIKTSAVRKGLISADQADQLLPKDVIGLIFKPGFSTASGVDKNAGRGIGMDVIAATVKEMDGKLGVKSVAGKFCEFTIKLPQVVNIMENIVEVN